MEAHRRPDTEAGDDAKVVTEATGEYPLKPMALTAYKKTRKTRIRYGQVLCLSTIEFQERK